MKIRVIKKIYAFMKKQTQASEHQFVLYGSLTFISFILFYFINQNEAFSEQPICENMPLRITCSLLAFFLIFHRTWPEPLKKFLPFYWYMVLLCNLPFFFSFMFFNNSGVALWQLCLLVALSVLFTLADFLSALVLSIVGVIIGYIAYFINTNDPQINKNIISVLISFLTILAYYIPFVYQRESVIKQKIKALQASSAAIAHEMRTPFAAMRVISDNIEDIVHDYQTGTHPLNEYDVSILKQTAVDLKDLTYRSNHTINMMLQNLKGEDAKFKIESFSMRDCVEQTIRLYPFLREERKLVHTILEEDFQFFGDRDLLQHVLFNFLSNSLYFIQAENKGEIWIELKCSNEYNTLSFRDTAKGVSTKDMPDIFKPFYSKRPHGTGIGLAFSKQVIEKMGGNITCHSKEGEYVTFEVKLPKT